MKLMHWAACAVALSILNPALATAGAIKKQKDFVSAVAGKKLVSGAHWLVINADGKMNGISAKGEKVVGAWVWHRRFFCRNVYVGQTPPSRKLRHCKA